MGAVHKAENHISLCAENGGKVKRTFAYDAMSRLTSETNPETGTITYKYDSDSNCASPNSSTSDLISRTDARSIRTCFQYDTLHRLTQKNYSDGTPTASYAYDLADPWGSPYGGSYKGRLSEADTTSAGQFVASTIFVYDPMGRVTTNGLCTAVNCGLQGFHSSFSYDLAGDLTSYGTAENGITFSYQYDAAGRPTTVTSSLNDSQHPPTLATVDSSVGYYAPGALRKMTLGNNLTQTAAFNNDLQPCRVNVNSSGTALGTCADNPPSGSIQDFTFQYNAGTSNNGNVVLMAASGTQEFGRNFSYDSLNRLATMSSSAGPSGYTFCAFEHEHCTFSGTYQVAYGANGTFFYQTFTNGTDCDNAVFGDPLVGTFKACYYASAPTGCLGLSWAYDPYGNRTDQNNTSGTCGQFHATVNSNNWLSGSPYQYDAAGNMINDGNHAYYYDAEERLIQVDGTLGSCSAATACYSYDALGQRTQKTAGSAITQYVHDLSGRVILEMNGSGNGSPTADYIYLGGNLAAEYANSTTYFAHSDHLGSTRLLTGLNQGVVQNLDYLPFGELNSTDSGITTHKFTGDERDSETNLDHTWFRQYSSQLGRWMHPDPAGLAAVDPSNPQSWNRYSYVLNNPLSFVDPFGLDCVFLNDAGDGVEETDTELDASGCGDLGGVYFAGTIDPNSLQFDPNSDWVFANGTAGNAQFSCGGSACDQSSFNNFYSSIGTANFGQANASTDGSGNSNWGFLPGPPPPPKGLKGRFPPNEGPTLQKPPVNPVDQPPNPVPFWLRFKKWMFEGGTDDPPVPDPIFLLPFIPPCPNGGWQLIRDPFTGKFGCPGGMA